MDVMLNFFPGILFIILFFCSVFMADHLYGVFAMRTNQWNRRFLQSMLFVLLLMFFIIFVTDSKAAAAKMMMGQSTYKDFKETFPDQAEGDFGLKLKELNEKSSGGRDSSYWREALLREFDLSYEVGNHSLHSGYYFVTNIKHSALDAIPVLGSKTEKILCLMIYETESKISSLLVCKDPEHDMLVVAECKRGNL